MNAKIEPQSRIKSDGDVQADVSFEKHQRQFFLEHPEVLLAPTGDVGEVIRKAERVQAVNLLCGDMHTILDGRKAVCGVIGNAKAELHGPLSPRGKGSYFFKSVELAARLTPNDRYDTWVPGGFSIVPIGLDEVREKLGLLTQNEVRDLAV